MTREEAIQILQPFRDCMVDQHGCPISDAVPALDVAIEALSEPQIIRCKDCKFAHYDSWCKFYWCHGYAHSADWFCADAERIGHD